MVWAACIAQPAAHSSPLSVENIMDVMLMVLINERFYTQAMLTHLSFCEVISQVVEKFVEYLKPGKITVVK